MNYLGTERLHSLGKRCKQHGAAFVEFAVVLPLLILMMVGILEVGSGFLQYNTLNKLVRNGVRYLSDTAELGSTGVIVLDSALVTEIRNLVVYGKIGGGGTPLLPDLSTSDIFVERIGTTDLLRVRAEYDYPLILGSALEDLMSVTGASFPATMRLTASVVMRAP